MTNFKLSTKLIVAFVAIIFLAAINAIVAFWGVSSLLSTAHAMEGRAEDSLLVEEMPLLATRMYQVFADLVLNKDLELVAEFDEVSRRFNEVVARVRQDIDTPEEVAWLDECKEAADTFYTVFHDQAVPEIEYELTDQLRKLDAQSDDLINELEGYLNRFADSVGNELDAAMRSGNAAQIRTRLEQTVAIERLKYRVVKMYQIQADMIINEDLSILNEFEENASQFDQTYRIINQAADNAEEQQLIQDINRSHERYENILMEEIIPAIERQLERRVLKLDDEADAKIAIVQNNAHQIADSLGKEYEQAARDFDATATFVLTLIVVMSLVIIASGITLALVLARSITRPINRVVEALKAGSAQVTSASNQIAQASQQMAANSSEQASSLEEISSSIEQLTSMTVQNKENSRSASNLATEANNSAVSGNDAAKRMSNAAERIKSTSDESAKIVKTIDEIAFQTNLLALNAAVEAARAGDAGKGFAVVAEEVRSLAQRSAEAAKTTSELIAQSQSIASDGVNTSSEVEKMLAEITDKISKVNNLTGEVAAASEEQAAGINQINNAMGQIDKVTQANAANSEETASSSEELNSQATELSDMLQTLIALVEGQRNSGSGVSFNAGSEARLPGRKVHQLPGRN